MDSLEETAARRASDNFLIMQEIFSWVEDKKDLRHCLILNKDSFVAVLKPMFSLVKEGVLGKIAAVGTPLGRYNQYALAITGLQLHSVGIPQSQKVFQYRQLYPNLARIWIFKVENYPVTARIALLSDWHTHQSEDGAASLVLGDLALCINESYPSSPLSRLIDASTPFRLKALHLRSKCWWSWKQLQYLLGAALQDNGKDVLTLRLSETEELRVVAQLTSSQLSQLLMLFRNLKRISITIDCLPASDKPSIATVALALQQDRHNRRHRLRQIRVIFLYPSLDLFDAHLALQSFLAVPGIEQLEIQHSFCPATLCYAYPVCQQRTLPAGIAYPDSLRELVVIPIHIDYFHSPENAARDLFDINPQNVSISFSKPRTQPYMDSAARKWVETANQALRNLRSQNGNHTGYRKLDANELPFPVAMVPPMAIVSDSDIEAGTGEAKSGGTGYDSEYEVDGILD